MQRTKKISKNYTARQGYTAAEILFGAKLIEYHGGVF